MKAWALYVGGLTLLFASPLARLMVHAYHTELHSHIVLVPAIVGYLLHVQGAFRRSPGPRSWPGALTAALVAGAAFAASQAWGHVLSPNDRLALSAAAYVALVIAGAFGLLGAAWVAASAFPLGFLVFLVPLPDLAVLWLETASQHASAHVAEAFFHATGTPLVRHGMVFELPRIVLEVARECSGIRSSWALFITSVLASHLFLRSRWRRAFLVAFVIPLGIVRNGFRVLVIGLLCVYVGPHMVDTPIHHQGGPLFFALSLIPLFFVLWWLRRQEPPTLPPR